MRRRTPADSSEGGASHDAIEARQQPSFVSRTGRHAAAVCASLPLATAAAVTPIKRVGGSHLKTSLNAYSFLELLNANLKDSEQGRGPVSGL